ncbi:GNAT family N-acetyltransferase [Thermithiobacillus plumbiphilus]|uniref:GNAT family N-acetyltransferase n=1 Tax=Thermithiobacillus plumbiphilus TaxID=1729899 RepID=A0ABU9D7N9_9PROT
MLTLQLSEWPSISEVPSPGCPNEVLQKAFFVRSLVFCGEQGIGYALEYDGLDAEAIHILGRVGEEPVASGRIRFPGKHAKLERIAVRAPWRGKGYGHQLTAFMIQAAEARGFARQKIHAQAHLQAFYAVHGFRALGEPFMEAGIEHVLMQRGFPAG